MLDDREGLQPEEVELHQTGGLDLVFRKLRDEVVLARRLVDRHVVPQRPVGDDHAGRVHARLPVEPLERDGDVEQLLGVHRLVVDHGQLHRRVVDLLQPRLARDALLGVAPDGLLQADAQDLRHQLGDAVAFRERQAHDADHVLDHAAGLQLPEGDDLADVVLAVLLGDVGDDLAALVLAEVDVEVRHRHALRVEEALEEQVVRNGVQIGDAQRIRHDRACARAAAPARPARRSSSPS